jgi:hypothetical protein
LYFCKSIHKVFTKYSSIRTVFLQYPEKVVRTEEREESEVKEEERREEVLGT